ncbi:DUF2971 domain-containing protein [Marivirga harenae]|uniref:DUF2971 domain-containing protein n=1 Tax=Marivirga harenae TaxID=2010992 RepID=UPI0026E020E6|nr:DUF2971 domain-containing protein [Marivirga harenae]WKV12188.1 DUF2971 domain-containing protein [Marivirga harenae]
MSIITYPALIEPDDNLTIWRYMDLEKFESLLNQKSLFFCRSDKFSDPYEGSVPKREVEFRQKMEHIIASEFGKKITTEEAKNKSDEIGIFHQKLKRSFIVNCWHQNDGESDAMWRLYLKSNEGVAIQSTVRGLKAAFESSDEEVAISKVRYLDYEKDVWYDKKDYPVKSYNLSSPIIHKRKAFEHERELRLFAEIQDAVHDDYYWEDNENGKFISCDLNKLIHKIILPPTSGGDVKRKVEEILGSNGKTSIIEKSSLLKPPVY